MSDRDSTAFHQVLYANQEGSQPVKLKFTGLGSEEMEALRLEIGRVFVLSQIEWNRDGGHGYVVLAPGRGVIEVSRRGTR